MRTLLPLLAVLSLTDIARADVAPLPGFKYTRGHAIVHFGPDAEKYKVYAVCRELVEPLSRPTAEVHAYNGSYRGSAVELCAIPEDTPLPEWPTAVWLKTVPGAIWSGPLKVFSRGSAVILDPRDGDEVHYRVTFTDREIHLELTDTRAVWSWPTVIVMGALSLALALGGIWLARRFRRKSVTRTPPPPSN